MVELLDQIIDKSPIKSLTQVVYRDHSLVAPLGVGTRIVQTKFLRHIGSILAVLIA